MALLTNFLRLANNRLVTPTAKPTMYWGPNGIQPPYGTAAAQYFAGECATIGFNANRSAFTWSSASTGPGIYDWTNPDDTVNSLVARNIRPVIQHIFTPFWANTVSPNSDRPYADVPLYTDTTNWNAWVANHVAFAQAGATRYTGKIDWEVWNEMNTPSIYWRGGGSTTAIPDWIAYGHLYAALYTAIKAIDSTAKISIGGLLYIDSYSGTGTTGSTYLANLKTVLDGLGVTPDAVAIHPYVLGSTNADPMVDQFPAVGKNSFLGIGRMQKKMKAIGYGNVELWVTEDGFIDNGVLRANGSINGISEANKALWIEQRFQMIYYLYSALAVGAGNAGVTRYLYYKLENYSNGTSDTDSTGLYTGSPTGGPHTILQSGIQVQAFMTQVNTGQPVPWLNTLTLTAPTLGVIGDSIATCTTTGLNQMGTTIGLTPIYYSSDPTVATVNSSTGAVTLVGAGTCVLSAKARNTHLVFVSSNPVTLTVQAQVATTGTLLPNPFAIAVSIGGTATMVASYLDQIGNPITGQPPGTFTSSDPTNAPVDPVTGIVTAVGVSTGVVITFTPTTGNACTATGNVTQNPVLQITNAPSTLINVGALLLTVTDGSNPVTGCTFVISDGTKAVMSGQYLVGVGSSGTFTLKAQKATYNDSVVSTITSTGGGVLDDKDIIALPNGASVTTYTDLDGIVWASASPPTYAVNDYNGHASLVFDGTSQFLRSNVAVSRLNGSGFSYLKVFTPTSTAPASNEIAFDNRDQVHGEGFVIGRNQTTMAPYLGYYTAPSTLSIRFDGAALSQNTQYRQLDRVSNGHQSRWTNGVANGTQATDATYRNETTGPLTVTKGAAIAGSSTPYFFAPEKLSLEIFVNRDVSDAEATQMDQKAQLYIATAATPYLYSLTVAGDSSVIATHPTAAYTASGLDQYGNPISIFPSGQTPTFLSSNSSTATIDAGTGIATGVAAGSSNISATVGALASSNVVALTVNAQVATTSVVSPSSWSRTVGGSTLAFSVVVSDQAGSPNPISSPSGAWSSSDPTNAPINSSTGVMTPVGASVGAVITFTPTGIPGAAGTSTGTVAAGGAPFLTSITISGPSTGVVTHATSAYTASGFDQYGSPFSFTPTWNSASPSKATINSSGIATGVAAGTSSITATGSGATSNAITVTIAAQVATTVTVSPSSFTIGAIGGTQALSASVFDQLGGSISSPSVSWGSSDVTKATVNSSTGVVTDIAVGTATITATSGSASGTSAATLQSGGGAVGFDTTSYTASTGAGIGGSSGAAPMVRCWDAADRYTSDTQWRAKFASKASLGGRSNWIYSDNTKDGTGTYNATPASSAQYDDGVYIDLAVWQNTVQHAGLPTFKHRVVGANVGSSAPVPNVATRLTAGVGEGWIWFRRAMPNWTNVGDANSSAGLSFNATQNASLKFGGFFTYSSGRAGLVTSNGSGHTANIEIENNPGNTNGLSESFGGFNITNEWSSGAGFIDYLISARQLVGGNGHVWAGLTAWERPMGSAHYSRISGRLIGDTLGSSGFNIQEFVHGILNMNQSFLTEEAFYQWAHAAWDRASNSDPFGVEAYEAALTPAVPLANSLNHQTGGSITSNVQINLYTAFLRPVVDGSDIAGQDFTIVSTVSEGGIVTPTVTGLAAGSHTVGWKAVNANNSAASAQSATISVTV